MNDKHPCESCGMPIETGPYCPHCIDPSTGELQAFDERFERMVTWQLRKQGGSRQAAEQATLAYMATMPAWKDHPRVRGA